MLDLSHPYTISVVPHRSNWFSICQVSNRLQQELQLMSRMDTELTAQEENSCKHL